jgi:putative hemolysin
MPCFAAVPAEVHWGWTAAGLVAVPVLVALNGFFVAAEFALVAVRRTRVEELASQGVRGAASARDAVAHLDRTIAATQLGITLASIALGWAGEPALARLVEPLVAAALPDARAEVAAHAVAFTTAFGLITFLHVVFGELIPKTLALQLPDRTSLRVATPLNAFVRLTRPFVRPLN